MNKVMSNPKRTISIECPEEELGAECNNIDIKHHVSIQHFANSTEVILVSCTGEEKINFTDFVWSKFRELLEE